MLAALEFSGNVGGLFSIRARLSGCWRSGPHSGLLHHLFVLLACRRGGSTQAHDCSQLLTTAVLEGQSPICSHRTGHNSNLGLLVVHTSLMLLRCLLLLSV